MTFNGLKNPLSQRATCLSKIYEEVERIDRKSSQHGKEFRGKFTILGKIKKNRPLYRLETRIGIKSVLVECADGCGKRCVITHPRNLSFEEKEDYTVSGYAHYGSLADYGNKTLLISVK